MSHHSGYRGYIVQTLDISLSDEETRRGSSLLTPVVVKRFASHVVSGVVNDLVKTVVKMFSHLLLHTVFFNTG
jgi:hypothetical protein